MRADEQRTVDVDVQDLDTRGRSIVGYAAVYGALSDDLGGFRERIEPGAFAGVLDSDVRCLVNHDPSQVLGRTRSGTLRLADEERGLRFECDLPDSPLGENVREAVRRGDVDGASFRFQVGEERWEDETRTILSVTELHDVTVATYGAYPAASVELRTRSQPPRQEEPMEPESREGGGLAVEDRTGRGDGGDAETRVMDAMRATPKGEARSLTHSNTAPVQPDDLRAAVIEPLRDASVVVASGVRVIDTQRSTVKQPVVTGDPDGDWYDELDEITADDPELDELEIGPMRAVKALVRGSSEAFEDSSPDLLQVVTNSLTASLGLKSDAAYLRGDATADPKSFDGIANLDGIQTLDAGGEQLENYDLLLVAGAMIAENAPGAGQPVSVLHPRVVAQLGLAKESTGSNLSLPTPEGVPRMFQTRQVGLIEPATPPDLTTILVYVPSEILVVRRTSSIVVEVDRSREFETDAVLVRARYRTSLGVAPGHEAAVLRIDNVAAPPIETLLG